MSNLFLENLRYLQLKNPILGQAVADILPAKIEELKDLYGMWHVSHKNEIQKILNASDLETALQQNKPLFIVNGLISPEVFDSFCVAHPEPLTLILYEPDLLCWKAWLQQVDLNLFPKTAQILYLAQGERSLLLQELSSFLCHESVHKKLLAKTHLGFGEKLSSHNFKYLFDLLSDAEELYWQGVVGSDPQDALVGLGQIYENLKHLPHSFSIESLFGYAKDLTGVVVASGPSLANKFDFLKELVSDHVLISADTSLQALLENNIIPFGVTSIERVPMLQTVFRGFEIPKNLPLFHTFQLTPEILNEYPGPICGVFRDVFPFHGFKRLMPLWNVGLSCVHLATILLLVMGCRRILLVGQDLAYQRQTGGSHHSGVATYAQNAEAKRHKIYLPDHLGGQIASQETWKLFKDFYELLISNNPQCEFINLIEPEHGAKIHGARRVSVNEYRCEKAITSNLLAPVDFVKATQTLQTALKAHPDTFLAQKQLLAQELESSQNQFELFFTAKNIEEMNSKLDSLKSALSKEAWYMLEGVWRSLWRRFLVCAYNLWDEQEFLTNKVAFEFRSRATYAELLKILNRP